MRYPTTVAFVLLGLACAAGSPLSSAVMVFPGADWATSTPEAQGVNSTLLNDAVNYLRANAPSDGVNQLAVIRNGTLIWSGPGIDSRHGVWSCTKSFTSTVLGLLVDDGRTTLDTRVAAYLSSMSPAYPDVSFRHFTTMTSGYFAVGDSFSSHGQSSTPFAPSTTPLFTPPGSKYAYWDSAMNQFAHGLTRVAGEPIEQLFKRRIADPIGMRSTDWNWGDWGTVNGLLVNGGAGNHGMMEITARQMARLGHLFLNRGNWNGQQLISASWVDAATRNQVPSSIPMGNAAASPFDGRGVYGFNWWANGIKANGARLWPGAPPATFAASGANNNEMFVIPDWGMVIVRMGLDGFSEFSISDAVYSTFLQKIGQSIGTSSPPPPSTQTVSSFTLVNADTNQDLGALSSGATLNLATLPTRNLNVRADTNPSTVGSVRFALDGNTNYRIESTAPYALGGDASGDYSAWTPPTGSHTLTATPYTGSGGTGAPGTSLTVTFTVTDNASQPPPPSGPAVVSLTLVNADTDQDIGPLTSGMTIASGNLNVRANTSPFTVGSVRFALDGNPNFQTESTAPYALVGDTGGDYAAWTPASGSHSLTATPFTGSGGTGTAGTALTVTFTVQGGSTGGGGIDTSPYRIGLSHDGNQHDPDDILALPMALAIIGEANLQAKFVHCDYGNHLGDNDPGMDADMQASALGAAQRWNLPTSRLFNCQTQLTGAINSVRDAINASSATNRFYYLCAGPMEVPWRGIMAADPAKRQYCTAISHSTWNETHADTPQMTHTWSDIKQTGVLTIDISDQNAGMSSDVSNWTWLRDSGIEAWSWLFSRRKTTLFDASDAGMVYFAITGRGDQNGNASKIRDLFVNGPGNSTSGGSGPQAVTSFTLINANTDQPVPGFDPLNNGATLNLGTLPTRNLNLRANTSPFTVGSVRFALDGNSNYATESVPPYALAGDTSGNYAAWTPSVGSHSVGATPYTDAGGTGTAGTSKLITFTVIDSPSGASVNGAFEEAGATDSLGDGGGGACGALGIEALLLLGWIRLARRKAI